MQLLIDNLIFFYTDWREGSEAVYIHREQNGTHVQSSSRDQLILLLS